MQLRVLPVLALVIGAGLWGCSERRESTTQSSSADTTPPTAAATVAAQPSPDPRATPDPAADHRARLAARVEALPDAECDFHVLQFQLIPRDEVLEPLSKPKKDLLRWVRRSASPEELDALERAMDERKKPMR